MDLSVGVYGIDLFKHHFLIDVSGLSGKWCPQRRHSIHAGTCSNIYQLESAFATVGICRHNEPDGRARVRINRPESWLRHSVERLAGSNDSGAQLWTQGDT